MAALAADLERQRHQFDTQQTLFHESIAAANDQVGGRTGHVSLQGGQPGHRRGGAGTTSQVGGKTATGQVSL